MYKAIILAAGEGTRMKSKKTKVMHELLYKPMITYVLDTVFASGCDEVITVVGRNKDQLESTLSNYNTRIVYQDPEIKKYGTGYAANLCTEFINKDDKVIIVFGDAVLLNANVLNELYEAHNNVNAEISVLSAVLDDPKEYGRIIRQSGEFKEIIEYKELDKTKSYTNEINSGIFLFSGKAFLETVPYLDCKNLKQEYLLTDAIKIAINKNLRVHCHATSDTDVVLGVNDREDLILCENILKNKIINNFLKNGVTIHNPETTIISPDVKINSDVEIWGNVRIYGKTEIDSEAVITDSIINDSFIGKGSKITNSVVEESKIYDNVTVGPYAHLRPKSILNNNVKLGNFVEIKNSVIGEGTKAAHLAYIGDADLGKNINIGCGVIFANYDGKNKHRSVVEDFTFVGSNSNIVAPVKLGKNSFIAAGSTITKDVEEGSLSIERSEQVNKIGWVEKKGLKKGGKND